MSGTNPRPFNAPGLTRHNAISTPIDPGLLRSISGGLRSWLGMSGQPGSPELPFFPPGEPIAPVAPGAAGRRFDYPSSYNINIRPRSYEPVSFDLLRALADPTVGGYDLLRLAIETRKDQMGKLVWSVLPRKKNGSTSRPKSDDRCLQIEELLRRPDGNTSWQQWSSQLVEEHLVIDAPTIYRRRDLGGNTTGLELMDGALIRPLLNYDGRRPSSGPAYQQVLKGVPAVNYTKDELLYVPRNPRVNKVYGFSCVEQVIVTVNIGLRRQAGQLAYFTEGNIPDAITAVPETWSTTQIKEFQDYWDGMVNDVLTRRHMRFVPAGVAMQQTRADNALVDAFDEWLARIIAYAFSLPPTPFVKMQNRATAETAYETSLSEGLQPLMEWLKGVIDYIIANWIGQPELELIWDDIKKTDPAEKEQRDLAAIAVGVISRDDMRAERGLEPLGIPPVVNGIGPLGFMSIEAMKKAIANGWDLTGMPQPGLGATGDVGAIPGADPAALGSGGEEDPLAGLPPEILEALGPAFAAPASAAAPGSMVPGTAGPGLTAAPPGPDVAPGTPGSNVIPLHQHPHVKAALLHGDRMARKLANNMRAPG
jgi:hypothetical protein